MANTGQPDSSGSQFLINISDNEMLDFFNDATPSQHPVFGRVVSGHEVVMEISRVRTSEDRPTHPIQMIRVTVEG
jgi:cyclophilin family peptidyl-prolyl cis-trans isomerase